VNELRYLELQEQGARQRLQTSSGGNRAMGFARDHPALAVGLAVAAGVMIGRLVISSRLGWVGALAWLSRAGVFVARPALRILASSLSGP
jgi:hypothetical protein